MTIHKVILDYYAGIGSWRRRKAMVKSDGPIGYEWQWVRTSNAKIVEVSKNRFDCYFDCVADARKHGCYMTQTTNVPIIVT